MTAAAPLRETPSAKASLTLVERGDPADQLAELIVGIVALTQDEVDPSLINPAALVLRSEGLLDLPTVTFGCNYELDVRSFELDRGYVRAIDAGWLTLRSGKVSALPHFQQPNANPSVRARAEELFSLEKQDLMRVARHHLLREADEAV